MNCPRCRVPLDLERYRGMEIHHCLRCHGRWLDYGELGELEATVRSTPEERRGKVEMEERPSDLPCPVCGGAMVAFDYRAAGLDLHACSEEHGFWLDAGATDRVRDIVAEQVRRVHRAERAEEGWGSFLSRIRRHPDRKSLWEDLRDLFRM